MLTNERSPLTGASVVLFMVLVMVVILVVLAAMVVVKPTWEAHSHVLCKCHVVYGIGDDCDIGGETHLGGPLTVAGGGGEEKAGEGEQTIVLLCLAFNRFHL